MHNPHYNPETKQLIGGVTTPDSEELRIRWQKKINDYTELTLPTLNEMDDLKVTAGFRDILAISEDLNTPLLVKNVLINRRILTLLSEVSPQTKLNPVMLDLQEIRTPTYLSEIRKQTMGITTLNPYIVKPNECHRNLDLGIWSN